MAKQQVIGLKKYIVKGNHKPHRINIFCRKMEDHPHTTKVIHRGEPKREGYRVEMADINLLITCQIRPDAAALVLFQKLDNILPGRYE